MKCLKNFQKNNENFGASFHHIGVACKNINETFVNLKILLPINIQFSEIIYDSKLKANLQLIRLGDHYFMELVSGKIVENILKKNMFLYHTCFEVNNIFEFGKKLRQKKFIPLMSPTPADLFDGRLVQFFQSPMGIVEILQK